MFKIGDKVKCIDSVGSLGCLTQGKIYTVSNADDKLLKLKELKDVKDDAWSHSRFELVKPAVKFDMNKESWFIRVNNETEYKLALQFCKEKGFTYYHGANVCYKDQEIKFLTNTDSNGFVSASLMHGRRSPKEVLKRKEIKLNFETKICSVDYPEVKSEKDIEIEMIEKEMLKLAERVKQLKGE